MLQKQCLNGSPFRILDDRMGKVGHGGYLFHRLKECNSSDISHVLKGCPRDSFISHVYVCDFDDSGGEGGLSFFLYHTKSC